MDNTEKSNGPKEILYQKNMVTGEPRLKEVPVGTLARIVSTRKGILTAGLFNVKENIHNPRKINFNDTISFKPPHRDNIKIALANAHESDPYIKNMTLFYTQYVFGDDIKPRLTPLQIDKPDSKKENEDLVNKIIGKKKHKDFLNFVGIVDNISKIYLITKVLYNQSFVFGSAAGWKTLSLKALENSKYGIHIPVKTPIKIKQLDGYYLGSIHQDMDTFEPKYLEYNNVNVGLDLVRTEDGEEVEELTLRPNAKISSARGTYLPYDRLIVFNRPNVGTTPNTSVYGVSPLLPALYISENLRRIDEKILPEINEGQYAGVGIFSVTEDSKYDIDALAEELSNPGTRIVLNEEVKYQPIQVDYNMDGLLKQKDNLITSELMSLGIPSPLFNFEGVTNRATMEIIINVWQGIRLQDERDLLKQTMRDYWYKDLMKIFFDGEELIDLALTVDLEFKNKSFTAFPDKAQQLLAYHLAGVITKKELRASTDFAPYSEEDEKLMAQQPMQAAGQMDPNQAITPEEQQQKLRTVSTVKRINNQQGMVQANAKNTAKPGGTSTTTTTTTKKKPVPK